MFNVGGPEVLVILLLALIVLGPQRLPDAARQVGKAMGELRRVSSGFQQELRAAMDEPVEKAARQRGDAVAPPVVPTTTTATETASTPAASATRPPAKKAATKAAPARRRAPLRAPAKPTRPPVD